MKPTTKDAPASDQARASTPDNALATERIPFRFHPRALAALGRDLVTNDVVAVMELVKNSYDALATRVRVRMHRGDGDTPRGGYIEIEDNGHGMDEAAVRNVWAVVATPFRSDNPVSRAGPRSRPVTGEKGLGRLSAARLGTDLHMTTKTRGNPVLGVSVNWERLMQAEDSADIAFDVSRLPLASFDGEHGTRIRIGALSSEWSDEKIHDLRENLARLVSPFSALKDFSLHLDVLGDRKTSDLSRIRAPQFMNEPKYRIAGTVSAAGTIVATYEHRPIGGSDRRRQSVREEWAGVRDTIQKTERAGLSKLMPDCGPFSFEIRAWDLTKDDTRDIYEHFREKRQYVRNAIKAQRGVSVYRDDVLVLPKSDGARDWLGLDLRRVSRVGVRLSTSQVVGYVRITKRENPGIVDTSDREGLRSNAASIAFRHIVLRIVTLLEQQRHVDRMREKDACSATDLFADLNAEPLVKKLEELREKGGDVSAAIKATKDFGHELGKSRLLIEKRFGYYNRLAVIGTIAQMVVHEIRNRTTVIGRALRKARDLARRIRDGVADRAVDMASDSVEALESLADRFAPLASRGYRPGRRTSVVEESIARCCDMVAAEIRSHRIVVERPANACTVVRIDPAEIDAVMLNLISNSLYWMRRHGGSRRLRFRVTQGRPGDSRVTVSVDDSGPGIEPEERERVFWPGVTRKPDGIGMGLTVASELVHGRGGKMHTTVPGELGGATFEFDLPLATHGDTERRL